MRTILSKTAFLLTAAILTACAPPEDTANIMSTAEVMESAKDSDWRDLDMANTVYMQLENGIVIIELAPQFAPNHVANIKTLIREKYFDGLFVIRSHDNYVAQWGDANESNPRSMKSAKTKLDPEWESEWTAELPFTEIKDGDIYQPYAGYSYGFPVAGDKRKGLIGLAHCYGMVGVGRDSKPNSGNGSSLYAVTGHAPRHLDRNVTLVGRVYSGMEHLSSLPRGTEALGFYKTPQEFTGVTSMRMAKDVPPQARKPLQILRTDTDVFKEYLKARRYRSEEWFVDPAGRLELCNVPMPIRVKP